MKRKKTKKTKNVVSYLKSYRRRWGLSQKELAKLLGWKSAGVVSRLEKKLRPPSLQVMIGCYVIFGTLVAELFPGAFADVEAAVMARVWEMYEEVQGSASSTTRGKIELFEDAIERATQRAHQSSV